MRNLAESKEKALNAYKAAKAEWMETVTKENIKGSFEKWAAFCDAKKVCMRLGVRI